MRGFWIAAGVVALTASPGLAQSSPEVLSWVEQVILGPEYGGSGKVCSRWVTTPTLSVFGGTKDERQVVAEVVRQLNEVLSDTPIKEIKLLAPGDETASIRIYFAPLKELPEIAKKHDFQYVKGNWGYFWTFWKKNEIYQAYILLASDKLSGRTLRHFALEEITQSLGLSNDAPHFRDSIFYSKGPDGGSSQSLSTLDKKLIRFFYNHVKPGDKPEQVRSAFAMHWPKN